MNEQFTAIVYCKEEQIAIQTGNDIDQLYTWMLAQVGSSFDDVHGELIDNDTHKTIRTFCKSPME